MRRGTSSLIHALVVISLWCAAAPTVQAQTDSQFQSLRERLVEEVLVTSGIKNERVLDAMRSTERHRFVAAKYRANAYYDMALPIGDQQTISSPFIVALMTEALNPQPDDIVLEIGTGSGYQAAILSPLVKEVYTIEIVESLGKSAARTLKELGYKNVHVKVGDGYLGWPEKAPFNKIIVTCNPEKVPQPLVDQLADGGEMVVPVGERYQQMLYLFKKKDGKLESIALRPTLFVPMTGAAEDKRKVKPDPLNPMLLNGGFEEAAESEDKNFVPGWYYHRLTTWEKDAKSPEGEHHLSFSNDVAGRASHLLQGFPIDGAKIGELAVSAWVKTDEVVSGLESTEMPVISVTFYDAQRAPVGGLQWIGPFRDTEGWREVKKKFRVPAQAKEGIMRIGLFGATGKVSFDNISMKPVRR